MLHSLGGNAIALLQLVASHSIRMGIKCGFLNCNLNKVVHYNDDNYLIHLNEKDII